jgi:hypothetical protein
VAGVLLLASVLLVASAPALADQGSAPPDGLVSSLLQVVDVPEYLEPTGVTEPPLIGGAPANIDDAAYRANGGLRALSQLWQAPPPGPVIALFDFRMQFPTAGAAADYLTAAEPILSEATASGLSPVMFEDPIGEDYRHYFGQGDADGQTVDLHNFLFRVGPVAAKVFIAGIGVTGDEARAIGAAAAARMATSTPPAPSTGADDALTAELLGHIPELIVETCFPDDSPAGVGTAVTCSPTDPVLVSYTLLDDEDQAAALFVDALMSMAVPPDGTSCEIGPYVGTYDVEGLGSGRILCNTNGSQQMYLWTRDGLPILTFAVSDTFDFPQLHAWWLGAGPNP